MNEKDRIINLINKIFNLERGILFGFLILFLGFILNFKILLEWINSDFGSLYELRTAIFALTLLIIGVQSIFSSFFLSILGLKR